MHSAELGGPVSTKTAAMFHRGDHGGQQQSKAYDAFLGQGAQADRSHLLNAVPTTGSRASRLCGREISPPSSRAEQGRTSGDDARTAATVDRWRQISSPRSTKVGTDYSRHTVGQTCRPTNASSRSCSSASEAGSSFGPKNPGERRRSSMGSRPT